VRNPNDIQRAHDILAAIVLGEVPVSMSPLEDATLHGALDCLCWVLEHDHNQAFAKNLASVHRAIEARGFRLRDSGTLTTGETS
jgi:hypothetical protein